MLGVEEKFKDRNQGVSDKSLADEWTLLSGTALNATAQGDAENERDGRKIRVTKIDLKGYLQRKPGTVDDGPVPQMASLCLFVDTQTNGTAPTPTDLYHQPNTARANLQFRNLEKSSRYKILWRADIPAQATVGHNKTTATGAYAGDLIPFEFHKTLKLDTNYTDTTDTTAAIADNSIWLAGVTNDDLQVTCAYSVRVRFVG